jgi:hypothetical protein
MNVRISKEYSLLTSIYYADNILNNYYSISLGMLTNTESNKEQNIAVGRINSYFQDIIQSGVFIEEKEKEQIHQLHNAGIKTIILPEQPFDQIIATMLFCKLNAICEDRLLVTDITVTSSAGDGVRYIFDAEDAFGEFSNDGWWNDPNPSWCEHTKDNPSGKVIKMDRKLTWKDIDLEWEETIPVTDNVVKGNFNKSDD